MTLAKVDGGSLTSQSSATIHEISGKNGFHGIFNKELTIVERFLVIISVVLAAAIVVLYTSIQPSKLNHVFNFKKKKI